MQKFLKPFPWLFLKPYDRCFEVTPVFQNKESLILNPYCQPIHPLQKDSHQTLLKHHQNACNHFAKLHQFFLSSLSLVE